MSQSQRKKTQDLTGENSWRVSRVRSKQSEALPPRWRLWLNAKARSKLWRASKLGRLELVPRSEGGRAPPTCLRVKNGNHLRKCATRKKQILIMYCLFYGLFDLVGVFDAGFYVKKCGMCVESRLGLDNVTLWMVSLESNCIADTAFK